MKDAKFGVHNLVFGDVWSEEIAKSAVASAAEIGFDLLEVLIFDPAELDVEMTRKVMQGSGLDLRLGMALGPDSDISSLDNAVASAGEATVERCLQIAADLGAPAVSGITYAAFNNYPSAPTEAQRARVLEALARLDARAGALGVKLGLEPVNRYESYLINTLDQAADAIRQIGARNLFVHMDTFHMNIEEADPSRRHRPRRRPAGLCPSRRQSPRAARGWGLRLYRLFPRTGSGGVFRRLHGRELFARRSRARPCRCDLHLAHTLDRLG
jgi:D-psicose/D-tagatose/L-ribulose 3-epimerase